MHHEAQVLPRDIVVTLLWLLRFMVRATWYGFSPSIAINSAGIALGF
jgi:hypothetical protein